jgi:hypothetical protein
MMASKEQVMYFKRFFMALDLERFIKDPRALFFSLYHDQFPNTPMSTIEGFIIVQIFHLEAKYHL